MTMDKMLLIGHLGADPETRQLANGQSVTSFPMACNREWRNREGKLESETVWYRISAWNEQGESCQKFLHMLIYERTGDEMKVLRVIVDEMPKKCDQECPFECDWQCRAHDWKQLYAEDFGKIPSWCPLELETDGWKPVSEKPTKSMYVLICHVGDDYARTTWYSENEGDFYWWGDKQDLDLWRPLPVAPKEVRV